MRALDLSFLTSVVQTTQIDLRSASVYEKDGYHSFRQRFCTRSIYDYFSSNQDAKLDMHIQLQSELFCSKQAGSKLRDDGIFVFFLHQLAIYVYATEHITGPPPQLSLTM